MALLKKKVMIVAAEASSALYAERLLQYWQNHDQPVEAFGVGTRAMEQLEFERLGNAEDMAVTGLVEVIKHWSVIKSTFDRLVAAATERQPDLVILMDYPDFNLRLAKKLKKTGRKIVYYIAPQVWAWRKKRIFTIQKYIDHVIVLFPFEADFYRAHDVPASFVGHPLLDEMNAKLLSKEHFRSQREKLGIPSTDLVVGLMPGSRHGELEHHLNVQIEAASLLTHRHPNVSVVLLVAPTLSLEEVKAKLPSFDFRMKVIQNDPFEMIGLVDVMLAASGTATLMVGLMKVPMVVMYRFKPLTIKVAALFMKLPRFFCIVNLVFDRAVVTELFQDDANPERIESEMKKFIAEPGGKKARVDMQDQLALLSERLGHRGATGRVAKILEELW